MTTSNVTKVLILNNEDFQALVWVIIERPSYEGGVVDLKLKQETHLPQKKKRKKRGTEENGQVLDRSYTNKKVTFFS